MKCEFGYMKCMLMLNFYILSKNLKAIIKINQNKLTLLSFFDLFLSHEYF